MKVAYWLILPPPPDPERDAVTREIALLQKSFGGDLRSLYPVSRHQRWLPYRWAAWGRFRLLSEVDRQVELHHVFGPGSRLPAVLGRLEKPVVYSVIDRVAASFDRPAGGAFSAVVAHDDDRRQLVERDWRSVEVVPAGIELDRFPRLPSIDSRAAGSDDRGANELTLLAGSAPWTARQFQTKGFDALLQAATRDPSLRLILLWRGSLVSEIERRIRRLELEDRVEVIHQRVDVSMVLSRCHAAVVLASSEREVRPFPHSLLEALSSGRPVLVSGCLALSELVLSTGCGVVVPRLDGLAMHTALGQLRAEYSSIERAVRQLDLTPYGAERFVHSHRRLYRQALRHSVSEVSSQRGAQR